MNREMVTKGNLSYEEQRRKKQLLRIRRVKRNRRRLLAGILGTVAIAAAILLLRGRSEESQEVFKENKEEVKGITEYAGAGDIQVNTRMQSGTDRDQYLERIEELAATDERYQKILDREEEYTDGVLRMCAQNEEALDFAVDYPDRKNDMPAATVGQVTKGEIPLFIQWDPRWGYAPYGSETIVAVSGCGPTCIAMVASGLTGRNDITPAAVAAYSAENGFLTATRDTSWDLMTYGGEEYGITGTMLGLDEIAMANHLAMGNPIIASVGPGDFTTGGHFIVLTDYDGEAFTVNDPNSIKRSEKAWTFERLKDQIVNMWYYTLTEW